MRLLALDTTTGRASAALVDDDRTLGTWIGDPTRSQAEQVHVGLQRLIRETGRRAPDDEIDAFAVAVGPGSFTGLRIGIAAIQGLAFATHRRLVPMSALEALAHAATVEAACGPGTLVATWVDAHRGEVYSALYRVALDEASGLVGVAEVDPPAIGDPAATVARWLAAYGRPAVFAGDGAVSYRAAVPLGTPSTPGPPLAETIARLAVRRARAGASVDPAALQPLYVRRPDAEVARDAHVAH